VPSASKSSGRPKKRTLIRWSVTTGPFGIPVLRGYDPYRGEIFTARIYASQMGPEGARYQPAWTDQGPVRLKGPGVFRP
jgi:hypothetical protein